MTDPNQLRLKELQALTRSSATAERSSLPTSDFLKGLPIDASPADPLEEAELASATSSAASEDGPAGRQRDRPTVAAASATYPYSPSQMIRPAPTTQQPAEIAQRVEQLASTMLTLRDQREFTLSLEEDTSRDDALVERLAEQTTDIIQQRDEMLYQRVMQAIEQRLAQSRVGFA